MARICALTSASILVISAGGKRLLVAEVEAQPVFGDRRTLLRDMGAEMVAQRCVQCCKCVALWLARMRERRALSTMRSTLSPTAMLPVSTTAMDVELAERLRRVADRGPHGAGLDTWQLAHACPADSP